MQQEQGGRARMRNKKSRRNALRTLRRRDTVGLLLLGKCEAGKSALLHRWMKGHFSEQYKPTVEDFHVKPYKHMGQCVNVGVIDMTGSWDFPAMMDLYLSRIDSVVFVYDIGSTDAVTDLTTATRATGKSAWRTKQCCFICRRYENRPTSRSL